MGLDILFYKTKKCDNLSTIEDYHQKVHNDREEESRAIIEGFIEKINNATDETYNDVYRSVFDFFADRFKGEEYLLNDEMQNEVHPKQETIEWLKDRGEYILNFNVECAYFRKVNFIYAFFENKLEDEVCFVTKSDLEDLYNRCAKINSTNGALLNAKESLEKTNSEIEETSNEIVKTASAHKDTTNLDAKLKALTDIQKELLDEIKDLTPKQVDVEELLPTRSGFFFGSTSYDKWYYNDVCNAATTFKNLLDEFDEENEVLFVIMSW